MNQQFLQNCSKRKANEHSRNIKPVPISVSKLGAEVESYHGAVANMTLLGVLESHRSKLNILVSASEAAEMILGDDNIKCVHQKRKEYM